MNKWTNNLNLILQFYEFFVLRSEFLNSSCMSYVMKIVVICTAEEMKPVFGVALQVAVDRSPCHDGIQLPTVVRECIDYVEEFGMTTSSIVLRDFNFLEKMSSDC